MEFDYNKMYTQVIGTLKCIQNFMKPLHKHYYFIMLYLSNILLNCPFLSDWFVPSIVFLIAENNF